MPKARIATVMRNAKLFMFAALGSTLATDLGCAGKIRYPSYYVLNLPAPVAAPVGSKTLEGSASVRQFSAPGFLRAGKIVYRPTAQQIDFYEYHRWAEDPRASVTEAAVSAMQARNIFRTVQTFDGRASDYLVTGKIEHLEEVDHVREVSIQVGVSAQLLDMKKAEALWSDSSLQTIKIENGGMSGVVGAMSQAVNSAVNQLVASMQKQVASDVAISSAQSDHPGVR